MNEVIVKYVSCSGQFSWVRFQVRIEDFIACCAWRLALEVLHEGFDSGIHNLESAKICAYSNLFLRVLMHVMFSALKGLSILVVSLF